MHDAPLPLVNGAALGRYTIIRPLGSGSFGHTYLAHDAVRNGAVAVKLFDLQNTSDWKARELFEREATVLRSLRHHGVPEVFDATDVEWQGRHLPLLSMEFIDGASLADIIASGKSQEQGDVLRLLLDLLSVLEYLHERVPPVLHRDIKPANIIVRVSGSPALVDFGSVRQVFLSADESGSTVAGTYGYMPYEQYMGQASPASDLFSLAATFLHLLTGRPPRDFMDGDGRILLPDGLPAPEPLRTVLARLLRASPQERFASARQTRDALLASPVTAVTAASTGAPLAAPPNFNLARLNADTREAYLRRLSPSMFDYMDTTAKPGKKATLGTWATLLFVSLATAGVYPASFWAIAYARRRRVRRFLKLGLPATARVYRIDSEESAFRERVARVYYEFEADGKQHRDSDQVLPLIAGGWELNQHVAVLYVAGDPYDSVIVG